MIQHIDVITHLCSLFGELYMFDVCVSTMNPPPPNVCCHHSACHSLLCTSMIEVAKFFRGFLSKRSVVSRPQIYITRLFYDATAK